MKNLYLLPLVALGFAPSIPAAIAHHTPVSPETLIAQELLAPNLNRAKNLARQAAEELNGGLGEYRAEPSMHGRAERSPYVENTDGSYTFSFRGRSPESIDFTIESEVTVMADGTVIIDYNGALRGGIIDGNEIVAVELNQAKNLARQAAEQANGGLGAYRAEGSMHGTAEDAPYVQLEDGTYIFLFRGRQPASLDYTYESEVAIAPDGSVSMIYNGALRGEFTSTNPELTIEAIDLNQAKNLARQAIEEANGGLAMYRAEAAMHGNPNDAPYVDNEDGSFTFTFKGRRPASLDFTFESIVHVDADRTVTIISNQEI